MMSGEFVANRKVLQEIQLHLLLLLLCLNAKHFCVFASLLEALDQSRTIASVVTL